MWKNIKSLFSLGSQNTEPKLPGGFTESVKDAITVIEKVDEVGDDEAFLAYLTTNGIEYKSAVEILLFLPIAFVRQLLVTAQWPDIYIESLNTGETVEKKDADTPSFQIIWQVTTGYFNADQHRNTILKIAGRSAEFHAINALMLDNPGTTLEEIKITPTIISR